jgi:hypothetical protein
MLPQKAGQLDDIQPQHAAGAAKPETAAEPQAADAAAGAAADEAKSPESRDLP